MAVAVGGTLDLILQARDLAGPRPVGETLAALLTAPPGRVWLVRGGLLLGPPPSAASAAVDGGCGSCWRRRS